MMDYVLFALAIIVLALLLWGFSRWDASTRKKYKREAYKLLDDPMPDAKKIKDTMTCLRLYGGRWRKDQESQQLIEKLRLKYIDVTKI